MVLQVMRYQVALQGESMLAKDQFVNTFHVANLDAEGTIVHTGVAAALTGFYDTVEPYLSHLVTQNDGSIKAYNLALPRESPPVFEAGLSLDTAPGGSSHPLPQEVASCLTYHSFPQTAPVKRQSWRGRVYLGPLNVAASDTTLPRPSSSFMGIVAGAGATLAEAINALGYTWVIASKVQGKLYPITTFFVDDSWDTQRSRGDVPTTFTRTTPALTFGSVDPSLGVDYVWEH